MNLVWCIRPSLLYMFHNFKINNPLPQKTKSKFRHSRARKKSRPTSLLVFELTEEEIQVVRGGRRNDMIKKITKIQNFGTYSDFSWNSNKTSDFKRYNLIYGWNYSGKTTLSRLFRSLEQKQNHPDYPELKFEIETENGSLNEKSLSSHNIQVRVFNEEFVEENFKWNDDTQEIPAVLILGKESIELSEKLKEKENLKIEKENNKNTIQDNKKSLEREVQNSLTNQASNIRNILSITNTKEFDKNFLEKKIEQIKEKYQSLIFSDHDLQTKLDAYRSPTSYEALKEIQIQFQLDILTNKVNEIRSKKISAQEAIHKLKENPNLNQWVRQGMELHKNEEECQFCGNPLPSDLFERLEKHFSREFDNLINEIDKTEKQIHNYKNELNKIQFPDRARLYLEFQNEYELKLSEWEETKRILNEELESLLKALPEKRNKAFDILEPMKLPWTEQEAERVLNELNQIISKNNHKIQGLDEEKKKIKEELLNHYTAKAIYEINYFEKKKEIQDYENQIKSLDEEISNIENEINEIKRQIIQSNIGAEKINKYLQDFFADDQLKLQAQGDGKYKITRGEKIAKNLSTGEKNIIALIYFVTKLEENNFNMSEAIIFIDDPVSSLDSNHIFMGLWFLW